MPTKLIVNSERRTFGRRLRLGVLFAVCLVTTLVHPAASSTASAADPPSAPPVVVSLSWDDGRASQTGTLALQQQHGFPATYYINSGDIGTSDYFHPSLAGQTKLAGIAWTASHWVP